MIYSILCFVKLFNLLNVKVLPNDSFELGGERVKLQLVSPTTICEIHREGLYRITEASLETNENRRFNHTQATLTVLNDYIFCPLWRNALSGIELFSIESQQCPGLFERQTSA